MQKLADRLRQHLGKAFLHNLPPFMDCCAWNSYYICIGYGNARTTLDFNFQKFAVDSSLPVISAFPLILE